MDNHGRPARALAWVGTLGVLAGVAALYSPLASSPVVAGDVPALLVPVQHSTAAGAGGAVPPNAVTDPPYIVCGTGWVGRTSGVATGVRLNPVPPALFLAALVSLKVLLADLRRRLGGRDGLPGTVDVADPPMMATR